MAHYPIFHYCDEVSLFLVMVDTNKGQKLSYCNENILALSSFSVLDLFIDVRTRQRTMCSFTKIVNDESFFWRPFSGIEAVKL
jgi:hypothetical protein